MSLFHQCSIFIYFSWSQSWWIWSQSQESGAKWEYIRDVTHSEENFFLIIRHVNEFYLSSIMFLLCLCVMPPKKKKKVPSALPKLFHLNPSWSLSPGSFTQVCCLRSFESCFTCVACSRPSGLAMFYSSYRTETWTSSGNILHVCWQRFFLLMMGKSTFFFQWLDWIRQIYFQRMESFSQGEMFLCFNFDFFFQYVFMLHLLLSKTELYGNSCICRNETGSLKNLAEIDIYTIAVEIAVQIY